METVKKIEELKGVSGAIRAAIKNMGEYEKRPNHYDKIGFGFNEDSRFAAHEPLNLRVDSWMGTYGNSGCGRILSVDSKIFNTHLLKVLSADFYPIMEKVIQSIDAEAKALKDKSIKELEDKKTEMEAL